MAYKGLAKEKEALDASFKVLSQKKKENATSQSEQNHKNEDEKVSSEEQNQFTDPLQSASKVMMKSLISTFFCYSDCWSWYYVHSLLYQ